MQCATFDTDALHGYIKIGWKKKNKKNKREKKEYINSPRNEKHLEFRNAWHLGGSTSILKIFGKHAMHFSCVCVCILYLYWTLLLLLLLKLKYNGWWMCNWNGGMFGRTIIPFFNLMLCTIYECEIKVKKKHIFYTSSREFKLKMHNFR